MSERISENEILIEDLQNTKIDKEADDYYPQLAVGLADNLSGVDVVDSEVNFRRSGGGAISDGVARIEAIKGNSVVWNQWAKPFQEVDIKPSISGITYHGNDITIVNWGEQRSFRFNMQFKSTIGHQYLILIDYANTNTDQRLLVQMGNLLSMTHNVGHNVTFTSNTQTTISAYSDYLSLYLSVANAGSITLSNLQVFDLTKMFGAGNEPTTIEEFYSRIPMGIDLNAYNEGEVIHMDVQSIESQGVNAWDEEWEVGNIDVSNGLPLSQRYIRSKYDSPIKVLPNTEYYIYNGTAIGQTDVNYNAVVFFYDMDDIFIKRTSSIANTTFTTPQNCEYVRFYLNKEYGTTYKNDICINISDTSINGKYFPYVKRTEDLSIIRKYFPQGMKSAGSAHDEIRYNKATQKWEMVQRIGEDNMWELNWGYIESTAMFYVGTPGKYFRYMGLLTTEYPNIESSQFSKKIFAVTDILRLFDPSYTDVATFKAMLQEKQVKLYYELAEPIVTELDAEDQFKDLDYQVWNCGTEKAIADGKSAPLAADITYGFNAIGKIKELESLVAQIRAKVGI